MTTFSQNFKKARIASGMTQNEVADHFGVTRGAVAQWESGATYPEACHLAEIAELLDVSLDVLFRSPSESTESERLPRLGKFWMVYGIEQRAPACRHWSEDSAKTEALRLAKHNPDIAFVVLEATWAISSKSVVTEFEVALGDNDIPF
ncbi:MULTISPECIES: helix-turn-helix domain-containing protein [Rhizobium/Agrobacterium group]|uniref:helix-turn-helix domain-containing protein n=1 Tax=Rhizobium oryzihabitans TaxID=2267833 RepID=UPI004033E321